MTTKVQDEMLESGGGGGGSDPYVVVNNSGNLPTITGSETNAIAIGDETSVVGLYGVSIGNRANVNGNVGVALGREAAVTAEAGVAIGNSAEAASSAVSIGSFSGAVGTEAVAIGYSADGVGTYTVAIGSACIAESTDPEVAAVAVGGGRAYGDRCIALGYNAEAGQSATHVVRSIAIGRALVYADNALGIGPSETITNVTHNGTVVIGTADSTATNQVVLADGAGNVYLRTGTGGAPTEYADDAAAATGGVPIGGFYRTGSVLKVRVS